MKYDPATATFDDEPKTSPPAPTEPVHGEVTLEVVDRFAQVLGD